MFRIIVVNVPPVHLMLLPLHFPDDKHVLVIFPIRLAYPGWQEYEQFDL